MLSGGHGTRDLDAAGEAMVIAAINYATLLRAWNEPDDAHTRYQIRALVEQAMTDAGLYEETVA